MPSSQAAVEPVRGAAISRVGASTLLDIDKIRELVDMMVANDLVEISLRDGETEVSLRRPGPVGAAAPAVAAMPSAVLPMPAVAGSAPAGAPATVEDKAAAEDDIELTAIKSPMVGTFYASAEPSGPPFVDMGSPITADTVVCIVEAMKVFNEIKADVSGTIERVLVKNEDPVEYGQPLFLVRPPG